MNRDRPIGVFDSGIGGLTVVHALMAALPHERILYFGDTARLPYGTKSPATVAGYAAQITEFLLKRDVKMLVVACNTMAAVALQVITGMSPVPVVDVLDAGAHAAVDASRVGRVGVLATLTTVNSGAYERAIHAHKPDCAVISQACPLFAPLVEEGWLNHPVTELTATEYLRPVLSQGVDTLVLGCTHYPLLKPLLARLVGSQTVLVDSAQTTAARVEELLTIQNLHRSPTLKPPEHEYYVTDLPQRFREVGALCLGRALPDVHLMHW
ncbi:MAG: glutamate racemase [Acidiferrobacter sp.]